MPRDLFRSLAVLLVPLLAGAVSLAVAGDPPERAEKGKLTAADVTGIWHLEIKAPNRTLRPALRIEEKDGKLVGKYRSPLGELPTQNLKLEGDELTFTLSGQRGGMKYRFDYRAKIRGQAITGKVNFAFGDRKGALSFTGRRESLDEAKKKLAASRPKPRKKKPEGIPDTAGLLGRKIENFTLRDFRGKTHSLSDYADSKVVVVYFMGTECPLAKLYGPRVQRLYEEFGPRGVAFLGVNSNVQDSITEIAAHVRKHGIHYPILKDVGNKVADMFGAERTPQVFVLDQDRRIRYYGRVDGQFTFGSGVGLAAPQQQRRDLAIAIEEVLANKPVTIPVTEAKGCIIGRVRQPDPKSPVTYCNQIARLIQRRCLECHRRGQIAPFAMTNYKEVAGWGEMIAEVVEQQRMPPWHANPKYGKFANENRLTEEEKQLIYTWVENGCPEGDPADLPPPRKFRDKWFLPREPDLVVHIADKPVKIKAEGVEDYRYYTVDPGIKEDKWVKLAECMPDNRAVVHHIIVYIKPPGQKGRNRDEDRDIRGFYFLAGYAPGTRPLIAPEGWAKKIPAGSKFIFEMHYTPIGTPQVDRSGIGLIFMDEKDVKYQMSTTAAMNHEFEIPPYAANHKVEARRVFKRDAILLSLFPHMHMRGKSFRYELIYPDKRREILLDVPQYDFNWQNSYVLAKPKFVPKGSILHCTAIFDNSEDNLANPDPSKAIRWGEQTWDEMMIGWYDIGFPVDRAKKLSDKRRREKSAVTKKESGG